MGSRKHSIGIVLLFTLLFFTCTNENEIYKQIIIDCHIESNSLVIKFGDSNNFLNAINSVDFDLPQEFQDFIIDKSKIKIENSTDLIIIYIDNFINEMNISGFIFNERFDAVLYFPGGYFKSTIFFGNPTLIPINERVGRDSLFLPQARLISLSESLNYYDL